MADSAVACIPMKLDCLVMNDYVGEDTNVKVAPITQPNYTFLRLDNTAIQNDVIPFTDLHYTSPVNRNQRLTDLGTGERRTNREGVYVAWTLPRAYRMGAAGTAAASSTQQRAQQGFQPVTGNVDFSSPDSRPAPTRWLIVRYMDPTTIVAQNISDGEKQKQTFRAWVLDGDRLQLLDSIPLNWPDGQKVDLQTDVSPFVQSLPTSKNTDIEQQAEVFVGRKTDIDDWLEDPNASSVPISLLNSSNDLFADYQPHNSNVFSMIDPMTFADTGGKVQKMDSATAHYYVIGWHKAGLSDPLSQDSIFYMQPNYGVARSDRMGTVAMQMKDATIGDASAWQRASTSADLLCHGAVYNVKWSNLAAPADQTAQSAANALKKSNPISVGTSAADSLIALVKAYVGTATGDLKRLEQDLIAIQSLIIAQENGVDANMQALDLMESYSFSNADGGSNWYIGSPDGSQGTFTPSQSQTDDLSTLNSMQAAQDNNTRTMQRISWDMFSFWWKFVSGALPNDDTATNSNDKIKAMVTNLASRWTRLQSQNAELKTKIDPLVTQLSAKQGTQTPFSARKDPTLVLGGVQAGWPSDFLDNLQIRIHTQTVKLSDTAFQTEPWGASWHPYIAKIAAKLPTNLQGAASNLLEEFGLLQGSGALSTTDCVAPLYHDNIVDQSGGWRDQWNGQPWFPLFVEWQAVYYHIPYDDFSLASRAGDQHSRVIRWGIKDGVDVSSSAIQTSTGSSSATQTGTSGSSSIAQDIRSVSGRCLILPQPTYSLATAVQQLLTNLGNNAPLDPSEVAYLKDAKNYYQLPYLSTAMTGLTSHLTTRMVGTHIKPTQRPRAQGITAVTAAEEAADPIGMGSTTEVISTIISNQTGVTPYG